MSGWSAGIAWSLDLETGNEAIDEQHKQLFKLTSDLAEASASNSEMLEETLNFLVAYTVKHFADEEALQVNHNFPFYESHKGLHDQFKETVGALVKQFKEDSSSAKLNAKVNSIIVKWLIQHIQREDFKIAAHIRKLSGSAK